MSDMKKLPPPKKMPEAERMEQWKRDSRAVRGYDHEQEEDTSKEEKLRS